MTLDIKELVKRLDAGRTVLLRADGDRDLGFQSNITTDTSMALADELKSAIDALEALAGEVERLQSLVVETSAKAGAAIGSCEVLADAMARKDEDVAEVTAERDELANWKASFLHENEQILASNEQLAAERDRLKAALVGVIDFIASEEWREAHTALEHIVNRIHKALGDAL
jgi:phage-related tail protein